MRQCNAAVAQESPHGEILEVARSGAKGCFPLIALKDRDEIVGTVQVEFGKDFSLSELFQYGRDQRQKITVLELLTEIYTAIGVGTCG